MKLYISLVFFGAILSAPVGTEPRKKGDLAGLLGAGAMKASGDARLFYNKMALDFLNVSAFLLTGGKYTDEEDDEEEEPEPIKVEPPTSKPDPIPDATKPPTSQPTSSYQKISGKFNDKLSGIGNFFGDQAQPPKVAQPLEAPPVQAPVKPSVQPSVSPPSQPIVRTPVPQSPVPTVPKPATPVAPKSTVPVPVPDPVQPAKKDTKILPNPFNLKNKISNPFA